MLHESSACTDRLSRGLARHYIRDTGSDIIGVAMAEYDTRI